jgi:PAS domain S-box-containing protein
LPVLSTAAQLRSLPTAEARRGYPARLRGVVTCFDAAWSLWYVQDATDGIYVYSPTTDPRLHVGQEIELEGISAGGGHLPFVGEARVSALGSASLPEARRVTFAQLAGGDHDCRRVEVEGALLTAVDLGGRHELGLRMGTNILSVYVLQSPVTNLMGLLDTRLRVRGVCGVRVNDRQEIIDLRLLANTLEDLEVLPPAPRDSFALAVSPVASLKPSTSLAPEDRVHLRGRVTGHQVGRALQLRDASGTIQIQSGQLLPLSPGQEVDVVGFPVQDAIGVRLVHAQYRSVGGGDVSMATAPSTNLPLLTEIRQVRQLKSEEARQRFPVRVTGLVTFYDAVWGLLFVQDREAGIYVHLASRRFPLRAGQQVRVEGRTDQGAFTPILIEPEVTVLGDGSWPEARLRSYRQLIEGRLDAQWVETLGVVRDVTREPTGHLMLEVAGDEGHFRVTLPAPAGTPTPADWIDARLSFRGVCALRTGSAGLIEVVQVWVPTADHVRVLRPAPTDPFDVPAQTVESLYADGLRGSSDHRVRVQGVVTLQRDERSLYVEDPTGGILVRTPEPVTVPVGERVDLVGFPESGRLRPFLAQSLVRGVGRGRLPDAPRVTDLQALSGAWDSRRVSLEGGLLRVHADGQTMTLQSEGRGFDVQCLSGSAANGLDRFEAGSLLRVTGICVVHADESRRPQAFQLLLGSLQDVAVLSRPPWWTPRRTRQVVAGMAVVILGAIGWGFLLRRQVREQTARIRRQLEHEAALERRFRSLVDTANDAIISTDADTGRIVEANRKAGELLGLPVSELIGRPQTALYPEEETGQPRGEFPERSPAGSASVKETTLLGPEGRRIPVEVSFSTAAIDGRRIVQGIYRDLTERKKVEEQLRKFQRAVEQSTLVIMITNAQGEIEYVNPRFTGATGYSVAEALGHTPRLLKSGETPPAEHHRLWQALAAGESWQGRLQNRKKTGELYWALVSISPIRDANGVVTHFLGIEEDITERLNLEAHLRQSMRMESIGQLAAGIAHDFNNLLTVIQGHLGLLLGQRGFDPDTTASLEEIRGASQRAADLVRQLLAFSRRHRMEPHPLDLNELIERLSKMLGRVLGEHLMLRFDPAPHLPRILADSALLDQALVNLAVNARDAMPTGGQLRIETAVVEVGERQARRNAEARPGRHVRLLVADTGCGMDEATREHIFEPFFTTKEVGKGAGLGLATVYGIIQQHRGWIEVESAVGQGTTFRLYFPVSEAPVDPAPEPVGPGVRSEEHETILVVEDELALRSLVRTVLRRQGYRVIEVPNGVEALESWRQCNGQIDLLLTDMVMPGGLSGRDLAERVRAEKPTLPVIYSSGYSAEFADPPPDEADGVAFLSKPYEAATLLATVRRLLNSRAR